MTALAGLTAERYQARERTDFAEEAVREMAKQDRERRDDLEMEFQDSTGCGTRDQRHRRSRRDVVAETSSRIVV